MADRIKGITVEIGGDTSGLSKALSGVNGQIKSTQSQLKDVERLLKLDPKNTELLRQRQELLARAIGETKDKLDKLKDAEKQVQQQVKEGKASQEQYEALQREIASTALYLDELEKAAAKSNVALSKVGAVADDISEKTGRLADKTKTLSAAATGMLGAAVGAAVKAGLAADDLNTLSKQSGFSTEQIQTWQYGADRVDVAVNDIVKANQKMKKNMVSTSKDVQAAWEKLGVSVVDGSGELRSSTDVFDDTVRALSKIENETERDTMAMTLFGKSADSLAGIIDDGGEAFRQFGQEAQDAGLILSQDALDSANEFNDAIDKLKAESAGTFAEVGTEIATMLLPFIEKLGDKISEVMEWVRGLDEGQLQMIGTILLVVAAASPVLGLLSGIFNGISQVTSGIQFLIANPIVALIAALIALVALIAIKGDEIQDVLQKVDDFMQNIFAKDWTEVFGPVLGNALNGFFATLKGIWNSVMLLLNGVIDFVRGVFTGDWERAWKGVQEIFGGLFGGLIALAKAPLNSVIALINGMIDGINWVIRKVNSLSFTNPFTGKDVGFHFGEIGKVPYLAKGGTLYQGSAVVGEAGPELLTMMGNRAIVQPLTNQTTNTNNLGGLTINVYGAPGQDVSELADLVADKIQAAVQRQEAVYT